MRRVWYVIIRQIFDDCVRVKLRVTEKVISY